ncbi:SBBP repeat-containing protein [Laspinema palackyanum]|uniref:SBBP repeat-containing protein n=1 Tax=Laspinema palackyanum TaxID=3231601 RepID=UPI00345CD854|nr:SBBP repeat-containing protein [Laspinema sp. D2c]
MLKVRESRLLSTAELATPINHRPNWIQQLGTANDDRAYAMTRDPLGHLYLGGQTQGGLGGTPQGDWDIWWAKYDSSGNPLWTQQLASANDDRAYSLTSDPLGNLYIAGTTSGLLAETNGAGYDALIAKYDSSGNPLWIKQFGSMTTDDARTIVTDSTGNLYIAGDTWGDVGGVNAGESDAWFGKYDSSGNPLWVQQLGSIGTENTTEVSVDTAGNLYVSGYTTGSLGAANAGGEDAWIAKYDSNGQQLWVRQFGTETADKAIANAVDSTGNIYLTGWTQSTLGGSSAGSWDAWIAKYDPTGNLLWMQQLGTANSDGALDIQIDTDDRIYLTGNTWGSWENSSNAGESDAWVAKYDGSGNRLWVKQFGSEGQDPAFGMAIAPDGKIHLSGWTSGDLGGSNAGSYDAWIAQLLPNSDPILTNNNGVTLDEGGTVSISTTQLQVSDTDGDAIVYTLTALPGNGSLKLNEMVLSVGNTFTQADIDAGLVSYTHDDSDPSGDRFQFTATDGNGGAIGLTNFAITVNPVNDIFEIQWIRELGTEAIDVVHDLAVDSSSNVYATGHTTSNLAGSKVGFYDGWVVKYDNLGSQQWVRQFGVPKNLGDLYSKSVAIDNVGNVYLTGDAFDDAGVPNALRRAPWVAKYDLEGNQLWIKQFGSANSYYSESIALDSAGNIYLAGLEQKSGFNTPELFEVWIAKYDTEGNQLWMEEFGTMGSRGQAAVTGLPPVALKLDSLDNLYVTGTTNRDLGGTNVGSWDAWVAKHDTEGNQLWIRQLGSAGEEYSHNLAFDSTGHVYLTGSTRGDLAGANSGETDAWGAKYDPQGNLLWIDQFGTNASDVGIGIAVDNADNIYLSGGSGGDLLSNPVTVVPREGWVAKYNPQGNQLWFETIGKIDLLGQKFDFSYASDIAVDSANNLYLTGSNQANHYGFSTVLVAKLTPNAAAIAPTNPNEIVGTEGDDTLFADVEDQTIFGQAGNDILYGNLGDDTLFADEGNDILYGDMGDDTLFEGGNDRLYGNAGDDILFGDAGNDILYGGKGNDFLLGEEGDDFLSGDLGDDTLAGGNGRDIFVLQSNSGSDIILDFIDGEDVLELPANLSFMDLQIASNNGSTLIQVGDDTLATLSGVEPTVISEEDFISL